MPNSNNSPAIDLICPFHWAVQFDGERPRITEVTDGVSVEVHYDCMFVILFYRDPSGTTVGLKSVALHRIKPVFVGVHSISQIRFAEKPPAVFVDVDGKPITCESILRLSLYARTDAGTIVVTLAPSFATDARLLSVLVSKQTQVNQMLQALTVGWFDEIVGVKEE